MSSNTYVPNTRDIIPTPGFLAGKDLAELSEVSYRQVNYWAKTNVIPISVLRTMNKEHELVPVQSANIGQGNRLYFPVEIIPKVRLLGRVSRTMSPSVETLAQIFRKYDAGHIEVGEGILLGWRKEK